ncbi:MAG: serine/threonine protein kinase [Deltaproteobacteria bacterium]|nr:serine/threonine protein kinase [Deltaproteobacteria bacterium]
MARFEREVSVRAETKHEGIVDVLDAGVAEDGSPYIAMELLEGESMRDRLEKVTDVRTKLALVAELLEPLAAAHAKGFVHRDLKPENAFVARRADGGERVKILDFGIARQLEGQGATQTSTAMGTPHYMAPEQAMSARSATPAADVWAVGVMLYEVVAGRRPFEGETPHAVILAAVSSAHRSLSEAAPGTSGALSALVDRCLAKRPEDRPRDASALRAELLSVIAPAAAHAAAPLAGSPAVAVEAPQRVGTGTVAMDVHPVPAVVGTGTVAMQAHPIPPAGTGTVAMQIGSQVAPDTSRAAPSGPERSDAPVVLRARATEPRGANRWLMPGIAGGLVVAGVAVAAITGAGPFARTDRQRDTARSAGARARRDDAGAQEGAHAGSGAAPTDAPADGGDIVFPTVTRTGRVRSATGSNVAVGTRCAVQVRAVSDPREHVNCKAFVRCGGHELYGSGTGGLCLCTVDNGELRSASDRRGVESDDDPVFFLDLWTSSLEVRDYSPEYSIEIDLDR